ncbi:MAG: cyclic dehypoxanthinyl futalosine synthase [Lentisphaeria bacterium]
MGKIYDKVVSGKRISDADALELFNLSVLELGKLANIVRQRKNPGKVVTYINDLNLNITNVCSVECKFCAFYRRRDDADAYVLTCEQVLCKVEELVARGGTQILMQGGINEALTLDYYLELISSIKGKYPNVIVHSFSPPEIDYLAKRHGLSYRRILEQLKAAGLNSLPGGGAEILVDRVRSIVSPQKISSEQWFDVMSAAWECGLKGTATMMFGSIESIEERVEHLAKIRKMQDESNFFRAFIPWSFSPSKTQLNHVIAAGGLEYLKIVAISRIYFDNIDHIGAGILTEGTKVAQAALLFGADDMGGVLHEEKVLGATGCYNKVDEQKMRDLIEQSGFIAASRNTNYELMELVK